MDGVTKGETAYSRVRFLVAQCAATLLLSLGMHPKVVQEILGHSQISMTMHIYSHVMPSMHQDAMDKLNEAIGENLLEEGKSKHDEPDDEQKAS